MSNDELDRSVVDWAIDHPESIVIFEQFQIEYCCGGKSLQYACLERGLDPRHILALLHQAIAAPPSDESS
jgi:iron-sulfur cluster repair protein YtfE (RIC family)